MGISCTGGIPPDGTPRREVVAFHLALVITYDILAAVGIAFTVVCLVFNFAFRKRKLVCQQFSMQEPHCMHFACTDLQF